MTITASWRVLQTPEGRSGSFLVKYDFHDSGYEIYLTDLCHIWSEQLQYEGVVRKAKENECDIDPSENADQRQKLFEKIASALNGDRGTSLDIKYHGETDNTIILELISPLPSPLSDVHWDVVLHEQTSETNRRHVTGPLLEGLHRKELDIGRLQQTIKEKDHVISRLLDRLESSGTDLTTVFPGTANVRMSRKSSQREQLSRYVRGLEPFDASASTPTASPICDAEVLSSALKGIGALDSISFIRQLGLSEHPTEQPAPSTRAQIKEEVHQEQHSSRHDGKTASDSETEDDDDFQVQTIPEKDRQKPSEDAARASPANSTVREDPNPPLSQSQKKSIHSPQSSSPPASKPEPSTSHSPAKSKARLGMIGGAKSKARAESVTTDEALHPATEPAQEATTTTVSPRKPKLGMIGGRKGKPSACSSKSTDGGPHQSGVLNGDPARSKEQDRQVRGRSPNSEASPPASLTDEATEVQKPRESSQDRADRRRNELKRQLASQPSGAKKKRKF